MTCGGVTSGSRRGVEDADHAVPASDASPRVAPGTARTGACIPRWRREAAASGDAIAGLPDGAGHGGRRHRRDRARRHPRGTQAIVAPAITSARKPRDDRGQVQRARRSPPRADRPARAGRTRAPAGPAPPRPDLVRSVSGAHAQSREPPAIATEKSRRHCIGGVVGRPACAGCVVKARAHDRRACPARSRTWRRRRRAGASCWSSWACTLQVTPATLDETPPARRAPGRIRAARRGGEVRRGRGAARARDLPRRSAPTRSSSSTTRFSASRGTRTSARAMLRLLAGVATTSPPPTASAIGGREHWTAPSRTTSRSGRCSPPRSTPTSPAASGRERPAATRCKGAPARSSPSCADRTRT